MPPKQKKPPATLTSGALKDAPVPKSSRIAWKTGEQLEYLLDQWPGFITHQTSGTLDRFWPRVYDMWYKKWPVASPTPMAVDHAGSLAAAILTARTENNQVRITDFYLCTTNHLWPSSEDSYMVSQQGSSERQGLQIQFATEPERKTKTRSHPSLLYLRLGFRPQGYCLRPLGGTEAVSYVCR